MLDMILRFQRPRIAYYVSKLRNALRFEESTAFRTQDERPRLSDQYLQGLPVLHTRDWIDDNENKFQFSVASLGEAENISRVALSAQSLKEVKDEIDCIFTLVDEVCSLDESKDYASSQAVLKQLLPSLFSVRRSPRFQASIKARLHARLQHSKNTKRKQHEAVTALKFLCRVYYSVDVFIRTAQSMSIFKSVECVPVPLQPATPIKAISTHVRAHETPLGIAKSLGLYVRGIGWLRHLENQGTRNNFRKLRGDQCYVHAEIQLLSHQTQFSKAPLEGGRVHPYIGCSKLCCLLCWLLLRVHGAYHVRGTHETIMHRWEIPTVLLIEAYSEYLPIVQDFLDVIRMLLQNLLDQPFPLKHPGLLAQSSAALSTTVTVLDRERAQMEKPQLNMRRVIFPSKIYQLTECLGK